MPINQKYQKDFLVCEILKLIFMLLLIVFFSLNVFAPIYKIIQGNEVTDECSGLDLITMFFQNTSSNIAPNDYWGALLTALFSILMAPYMLWRAILSVITLCQYDLYMEFQYCRELYCIKLKQRNPVVKSDTMFLFTCIFIQSMGVAFVLLELIDPSKTYLAYNANLTALISLAVTVILLFSIQIVRSVYSSKLSKTIEKEYYTNLHDNT